MATLPSKFVPLARGGLGGNESNRIRSVQFGDGYVQQAIADTNPLQGNFTLSFFLASQTEYEEFRDFIIGLGADFLQYTLPGQTEEGTYRVVGGVSVDYQNREHRQASITIERVYG